MFKASSSGQPCRGAPLTGYPGQHQSPRKKQPGGSQASLLQGQPPGAHLSVSASPAVIGSFWLCSVFNLAQHVNPHPHRLQQRPPVGCLLDLHWWKSEAAGHAGRLGAQTRAPSGRAHDCYVNTEAQRRVAPHLLRHTSGLPRALCAIIIFHPLR